MVPEGVKQLVRLARAFREADLPFMVVGAYAVMVHGWPRSSADFDFVVQLPFAERTRVEDVLRALGHKEFEERRDEWGQRLVALHESGAEVEVFFTPSRPPHSEEYARRVTVEVEGEVIPFLSAQDLVLRKLINTRLRRGLDFDDAVGVLHVQRGKLDVDWLKKVCGVYRVCDLLEAALDQADRAEPS